MRYFDPFKELDALRREVDRAFADFGIGSLRRPWAAAPSAGVYPLVNIDEDENSVVVEALVPGVTAESLDISVLGNEMTISGEKPAPNGSVKAEAFHRSERGTGRFVRTFDLPVPVDEGNVKAGLKNGVLTVTLAKAEVAKPKKIAVSVA